MNITVYRAQNQTSVLVELATATSKIIVDSGVTLEENEVLLLPELQAQYAFSKVDAVFLSHYNTDHVTMARGLLDAVPVYAGKLAAKMATAAEGYKAKKPFPFAGYYAHGVPIVAGDIRVTPFLVDDSLHEGYLLLIEGEGKRVVYAGDYRANGRKRFEEMLAGLPNRVDAVLCEGGVLTEQDSNPVTEPKLEEQLEALLQTAKGPVFALLSPVDFDRTETLFQVAKRCKRVLLEDLYLAQIAGAAGKAMPNPTDRAGVRAYLTTGYKAEHPRYQMFTALPRVSKAEIAEQRFVLCLRPGMKKYLKTLSQELRLRDGLLVNLLPDAIADRAVTKEYLAFAAQKGLAVHTLRCSGHANAMAVKALVEAVHPTQIMPLERGNVAWFAQQYPKFLVVEEDHVIIGGASL
ncbi:MAG: MBL fold metallo-hydrolase [Angelakisella sp.]